MKGFKTSTSICVAALIALPGICMAGGSNNTADTKVRVRSSAVTTIAYGDKSTADTQIGSIEQTGQSGSKATTDVVVEKSLVSTGAIGKKSTARTGVGNVVQK